MAARSAGVVGFTLADRWLLVFIVLGAALFRLLWLDRAPPAINNDVAYNGVDALRVLGGDFRIFFPENFGREPIAIYLQAAGTLLFGRNSYALRFPIASVGLLTVAVCAPLTLRLFCLNSGARRTAILATAVFATSAWPVYYNRVGWRAATLPLTLMLAVYFLARAREGRGWVEGGAWFGLGFYTYLASRLSPLIPAGMFVTDWLFDRVAFRSLLRGWTRFAVTAILVSMPLAGYFAIHPDEFASRIRGLAPVGEADESATVADTPERAVVGTIAMFFNDGGLSYQLFMPGRGAFDLFTVPFFWIGLGLALLRFRRQPERWLLLWLVVMILPELLARDRHPHYSRAIGALPPAMLLASLGLSSVSRRLERLASRKLIVVAVGFLIALSGAQTWNDYWNVWAANPETSRAFGVDVNDVAAEANQFDDGNRLFVLLVNPGRTLDFAYKAFEYLYLGTNGRTIRTDQTTLDRDLLPVLRPGREVWTYLFEPTRLGPDDPLDRADFLLRKTGVRLTNSDRKRTYRVVGDPKLAEVTGSTVQIAGVTASVAQSWQTADRRALAVALAIESGNDATAPDRVSIRLLAEGGPVIGQADRPIIDERGRLPAFWPTRQSVPVYAIVPLPGGLPAGAYRLDVVLYRSGEPAAAQQSRLATIVLPETVPLSSAELDSMVRTDRGLAGGTLVGYRFEQSPVRPGSTVSLAVYWQGQAERLPIGVLLNGPNGHVASASAQLTSRSNAVTRSALDLAIPATATGQYQITIRVGDDLADVGRVEVVDRTHSFSPPSPERSVDERFAGLVKLVGYDLEVTTRPAVLDLTLHWQSLRDKLPGLAVFVHVLSDGRIVGQRDGPPDGGAAPTEGWQTGEYLADGYDIPLPASLDRFSLEIGLVDVASGTRLTMGDGRDSVRLGPFSVPR